MGAVATIKSIESRIRKVEGFAVRIRYTGPGPAKGRDVRSDRRNVPGYPYQRARSDDASVHDWVRSRFRRHYSGYDVDILDGDGHPVHGRTKLSTVRATHI